MPFQYHQESAQFNIILVLINIIFKHNLKKLLNSLEFFLFNVRGTKTSKSCTGGKKTFWAILSFVVRVPKLYKRSC